MIPKQSHVYNEFAILYWFTLQCIFCVSLVSRRAEIDRTEFWASCAETNTWTLFVLRCLFSNHNLIHLLTWNGVVLCYAIFLFFCCAMQNNHLMKVWASIRRLMLLHPTANEKNPLFQCWASHLFSNDETKAKVQIESKHYSMRKSTWWCKNY